MDTLIISVAIIISVIMVGVVLVVFILKDKNIDISAGFSGGKFKGNVHIKSDSKSNDATKENDKKDT